MIEEAARCVTENTNQGIRLPGSSLQRRPARGSSLTLLLAEADCPLDLAQGVGDLEERRQEAG
jgi:hypothetical protein